VIARLERSPRVSWATCALTELGFVRLSSNPAIVGTRKSPAEAALVLAALTADEQHLFIETLPALTEVQAHFRLLVGHQQVTDAYLIAVAGSAGGTLLTLDRRVLPPPGAKNLVEVLTP
jgi:predicted nucleic acid-binding protein